ncbi:MAG: desulfoferrodoxin [Planctomycetaceae bacterium]|nr:desulfoferrodoxin [Planctomycetaceae bacterium]
MANVREIYVCEICGNIVEVLAGGPGDLVCCGQEMTLQKENTVDASKEKHIPVVKMEGDKMTVEVGSVPHPMEASHYIEWIEMWQDGKLRRAELKPGQAPKAEFCTSGGAYTIRAYCNLHGLWKG